MALSNTSNHYSVYMYAPIDHGEMFVFSDFSDAGAGHKDFLNLSNADGQGLLITGTTPGASDSDVNNDSDDIAIDNQWINGDDIVRLDFVNDISGNQSNINTLNYSDHYTVNDTGFGIIQKQGGSSTRAVEVKAYDQANNPVGAAFVTQGIGDASEQDDINFVKIISSASQVYTADFLVGTPIVNINEDGRNFTITFDNDGHGSVKVEGLLEGDQTFVSTLDGFNQLEIQNVSAGNDSNNVIAIGQFSYETFDSGDPVQLNLDIGVVDFDGDITPSTIELNLLPHTVGDDFDNILAGTSDPEVISGQGGNDLILGGDGNDYLIGGSGDDTLFGGDGDDILSGGTGTNELIGGAGDNTFEFDLFELDQDTVTTITDFDIKKDTLSFKNVLDQNGSAMGDTADLDSQVQSVTNVDTDSLQITLNNGATIVIENFGVLAPGVDSLGDLPDLDVQVTLT